jgi:hypothetical protein
MFAICGGKMEIELGVWDEKAPPNLVAFVLHNHLAAG